MSERFELTRASDLHAELSVPEKNVKARRAALRKVVSNMTVSNPEMLSLFPEILHCMKTSDIESKRMCYLYLETYAKSRPQQAADALAQLKREVLNTQLSPTIRAIALRTLSSVPSKQYARATLEAVPETLKSPDAYLRKTACFAAAKAWAIDPEQVDKSGVLSRLNQMLIREPSPVVVASAAQALISITEQAKDMQFVIDFPISQRLGRMLAECDEFSQNSLLNALMLFTPQTNKEAETIGELVVPGLRHTNAAVAVGTVRVLLMLSHYSEVLSVAVLDQIFQQLLSQLNRPPEILYAVLRNIQLILQTVSLEQLMALRIPPQSFFCRSSDVSYIRSTKIDILSALATPKNCERVVKELLEFTKIKDEQATRRAISVIGSIGARFEEAASICVRELKSYLESEEQAVTSLIYLVRRYPSNEKLVDSALASLFERENIPHEEEARCNYVWLVGTYYTHGPHAAKLLSSLVDNFATEPLAVQLALFTACIKLFVKFPQDTRGVLIPRVFESAADTSSNPDVRERALIYWRIVSTDPVKMTSLVNTQSVPVVKEARQDANQLEDLELSLGYLSSIYLKPADQLFRVAHARQLKPSKALLPRKIENVEQPFFTETAFVNSPPMPTDARAAFQLSESFSPTEPTPPPYQSQTYQQFGTPFPAPAMPSLAYSASPTLQYSPQPEARPSPPRPRNSRALSLNEQMANMQINPTIHEDHSECLIDI